jgi:hypothetical protein
MGDLQVQEGNFHFRWECVATVILWGLWRSRCKFILQDILEAAIVVLKAIWRDLVQTLNEAWSSIEGTFERCRKHKTTFRCTWDNISSYEYFLGICG